MFETRYMRHLTLIVVTQLFLLAISGCQSATQSPESSASQVSESVSSVDNVRVQSANPEKTLGDIEEFPLPNCGGSGELTQSLGTQASIVKGITVGAKATTTGGAEVAIPETAKLKLEVEVELAYQQDYEMANSRLDTIRMTAAAGTHVVYVIQWEEQDFTSIITFEMDGQVLEAPYTYVLQVPKINGSYPTECPLIGVVEQEEQPYTPQEESGNESNTFPQSNTPKPLLEDILGSDNPSNCHYASNSDLQTFINIIRIEEEAVLTEDLDLVKTIYFEDATIKDYWADGTLYSVIDHYEDLFERIDFIELVHYDYNVVRNTGNTAWVTASDSSVILFSDTNERVEVESEPSAAHFIFKKNKSDCWLISHFSKGAQDEPFP